MNKKTLLLVRLIEWFEDFTNSGCVTEMHDSFLNELTGLVEDVREYLAEQGQ